jgi:hypothetical protein
VFGEVLLHIRNIGVWARKRFGFLFFQSDDMADEEFSKLIKKKDNKKSSFHI